MAGSPRDNPVAKTPNQSFKAYAGDDGTPVAAAKEADLLNLPGYEATRRPYKAPLVFQEARGIIGTSGAYMFSGTRCGKIAHWPTREVHVAQGRAIRKARRAIRR